jgi:hypothetical protein
MADLDNLPNILQSAEAFRAQYAEFLVQARNRNPRLTVARNGAEHALAEVADFNQGAILALQSDHMALRDEVGALDFGLDALPDAPGRSFLGRAGSTTGVRADIVASSDDTFAGRVAGTVGFHSIDVSQVGDRILADIDLSAYGDLTIINGANSIAGASWTGANVAAATIIALEDGTGLHFDAAATSTTFTTATRDATRISIPVGTLIPAWDPIRTYVIDMYVSSFTMGSIANRVVVGLDAQGGGTDRIAMGGVRGTGVGCVQMDATTTAAAATLGARRAIGVHISPWGVQVCAGTYSGGFPTAYDQAGSHNLHTAPNAGDTIMDPTSLLTLAFVTGEAGGAMNIVIPHLRVRRIG